MAAALCREPNNPVDRQAIRVEVNGQQVGYIAQEFAGSMSPGLDKAKCKEFVVAGVIRGGADEAPSFGIHLWLGRRLSPGPSITVDDATRSHPDFAVTWRVEREPHAEPSAGNEVAGVRTGASMHGGRWTALNTLIDSPAVITAARKFLDSERDALERHYAFTVLEEALYRSRSAFPSALNRLRGGV